MIKNIFKSNGHHKGAHGLWLLLGALGFGYLLGRKKKLKRFFKDHYKDKKECSINPKQGWYGIVETEKDEYFREEIKNAEENNKTVVVEQKVINGYPTETILKK